MHYPIVVLSHCCSRANVIEPREPHTCNNILFFKSLKGNATGRAAFEVINHFFNEQKIKWQWCEAICTDGGAAMTGKTFRLGFMGEKRKQFSYF
jgi:hypothetical protein